MPVRILVADDQCLFREGLRRIVGENPTWCVVGEARDGDEVLDIVAESEAELVLMDLAMPHLSGLEATRRLTQSGSKARVLIVSATEAPARVQEALRAGAVGYVSKRSTAAELMAAVDAVRIGGSYLSPSIARRLARVVGEPSAVGSSLDALSAREREVLAWLAEGLSSREIGLRLSVSPRTVDSHRVRLMRKLGIHKVPGLVRLAIREGLIQA